MKKKILDMQDERNKIVDYKMIDYQNKKIVFVPNDYAILEFKNSEDSQKIVSLINNNSKKSKIEVTPKVEMLELDFCVTRKCNLRCKYCYANQTNVDSKEMDFETARKAIDFFNERFPDIRWKIDFIGQGEPLLNLDTVIYIVDYIKSIKDEKQLSFFLITNGTLLKPEIYETLFKKGVNLGISVDGTKANHNMNRVFSDGSGSYDQVYNNLSKLELKQANKNVWALSVATGENNIQEILSENKKNGFKRFQIKIARISGESNLDRKRIYESLASQYHDFFDVLRQQLLSNDLELFCSIINETDTVGKILRSFLTSCKNFRRCKAGFGRFSISTDGNIYPCSSFYSINKYKLGNVFDERLDEKIKTAFSMKSVDNDSKCRDCWCRYMCGGICKYASCTQFGDLITKNEYDCKLTEKICEEMILLIYDIQTKNPSIISKMIRFAEINQ